MELEGGRFELEVVERKSPGEGEAAVRGWDEWAGGQGNESGPGVAGLNFKAMPKSRGDLAELTFGDKVEVEEDEGEVSVAEEEVGALDRLLGFRAANPDEAAAFFVTVRGGVEGVAAIDESEGEIAFFGEEFGNDERGSGGLARGDDFAEMTGGEFEGGLSRGRGGDWDGSAMSGRELFTKLASELINLENAQSVFIRTLFLGEVKKDEVLTILRDLICAEAQRVLVFGSGGGLEKSKERVEVVFTMGRDYFWGRWLCKLLNLC